MGFCVGRDGRFKLSRTVFDSFLPLLIFTCVTTFVLWGSSFSGRVKLSDEGAGTSGGLGEDVRIAAAEEGETVEVDKLTDVWKPDLDFGFCASFVTVTGLTFAVLIADFETCAPWGLVNGSWLDDTVGNVGKLLTAFPTSGPGPPHLPATTGVEYAGSLVSDGKSVFVSCLLTLSSCAS